MCHQEISKIVSYFPCSKPRPRVGSYLQLINCKCGQSKQQGKYFLLIIRLLVLFKHCNTDRVQKVSSNSSVLKGVVVSTRLSPFLQKHFQQTCSNQSFSFFQTIIFNPVLTIFTNFLFIFQSVISTLVYPCYSNTSFILQLTISTNMLPLHSNPSFHILLIVSLLLS